MKRIRFEMYVHAWPWCWHCYDGLRGIGYRHRGALRVAIACRRSTNRRRS